MSQTASLGTNRTGITVAPELSQEMIRGMDQFPPTSMGSAQDVANVRITYAKEAEPVGSVPMPPGMMNKIQAAAKTVMGESPTLFLDKLGERLAFERAGTRLYEVIISKYDAYGSFSGGPSRDDLAHLLQEEYDHFMLLRRVIEQFGGDPTAVTPSANVQATASMGINKVIVDPRTTLLQTLEAILVAELADNECWHALIALARDASEDQLVEEFRRAYAAEQEHLKKVRTWVAAGQGRSQEGGGTSL